MSASLPSHAQTVIVGGGIVGCSVAYHLTKLGRKNVVLLEQGELTGGTTWHAAGLVTQLRNSHTLIEIAKYGVDLYSQLESETGQSIGFDQTGSITVARTEGRMDELKKITSLARASGVEIEPISVYEAGEMWPLMQTTDLIGAIHIPKDGQTLPGETAEAMAKGAKDGGVSIFTGIKVTGIRQRKGAVTGVSTNRGDIECEVVVNCGGMWAREIGLMCGVSVPLHAAKHMYLVTNPMGIPEGIRSLRDPDEQIYFRRDQQEEGALLMGGFESEAKPWGMEGIPNDFSFSLLEPDWEHFKVFWESAVYRVPAMKEAGINRFYVSAESFTPDNRYIIGEAPELTNFFVAAGLNSTGIAAGAGTGRAIAEWIVEGHPTMDLTEVDIRRFHGFQNGSKYLHDRVVESVGTLYGMHWPHLQYETARGVRRSPVHDRLAARRACFGAVAGWERPNWYASQGTKPRYEYSFGRQNWFTNSAEEHHAVRENVGLFDQTSFAKFLLQGRDAEVVMQEICANDVGGPAGRVVYTTMLNPRGGIEADLTVTRLSEESYMVITGATGERRDYHWIRQSIPNGTQAFLTNVTSAFAVLGVMGPYSREFMSDITSANLSNEAFPFLSSQEIEIGHAVVRATRITYVGELGWELYIPVEFATHVYDTLVSKGEEHGLRHAGFHSMESLRIEKGYRAWGVDLTDQDTPVEAGLRFAIAFDKAAEFKGKRALRRQIKQGVKRRLAMFTLDDPDPLLLGDEPIYRNGEIAGRITSGSYGHTIGRSVGMGYIEDEAGVNGEYIRSGQYEIEIKSDRPEAAVSLRPPYDPDGKNVHS